MRRVVFLVDMNAFFISCETTRNPSILGKPAAVAGDPKKRSGIILAANYEARKYGVKTTMVLHEAKKLCPGLILIPSDHRFYERKSRDVMDLLSRYTPVIEQNSIDEAWLDMTGCEKLFGEPAESARSIMDAISHELGLWCSIGISENKFLSKMASEMKKPLGITELWKHDIQVKLWPLPIRAMYGIGSQTADKLQKSGIFTIGDLANCNVKELMKSIGKYALDLHRLANGIDDSPVKPRSSDEIKSIGRSVTLAEDISDLETAKKILMELAEEVGAAARRHSKKGKTVQITIKYSNFQVITRQTTVPPTYLTKRIFSAGFGLLSRHWDKTRKIRLLGISISGFQDEFEAEQLSLFEDAASYVTSDREEKLEKTIDMIRQKHGDSVIRRGP